MSPSEPGAAEQPLISISGPPGVVIQVLDGAYNLLVRGAEALEAHLAAGLYIVRWVGPDATREEVVWLKPLKRALKVAYPGAVDEAPDLELQKKLAPIRESLGHTAYNSAVMVVERSDNPSLAGRLSRGLRLFNLSEVAMRSDTGAVEAAHELAGGKGHDWALRVYPVDAGLYRLRYEGLYGETLEQTVPAMAGRRTVVMLRQGVGQTLVTQGDGVAPVTFSGVDPSRTVMVTAPLPQPEPPDADQQRLAEGLVGALCGGGDVLSAASLARIAAPGSDPMLGLYAAALILEALEAGRSPALDDPWPRPEALDGFRERWRGVANDLLATLPPELKPDGDLLAGNAVQAPAAPPLLACAWRRLPALGEGDDSRTGLRAAAAGAVPAGAWLVWRSAAAKGGDIAPAPAPPPGPIRQSVAWLSNLGQQGLSAVLHRFRRFTLNNALPRGPSALPSPPPPPRVPPPPRPASEPDESSIPPLAQPVVSFDDPNKGRFGGQDSREGFTVSASFAPGADPAWVILTLTVTAAPDVPLKRNEEAIFVLHESFTPQRIARTFHDRTAQLVLEAYGGFTLGVWLPHRQVALELDLAALSDAPQVIRDF